MSTNNDDKVLVLDTEEMISGISATISQSNNQFGILVGEGEPYRICFPSEPLEYEVLPVALVSDDTDSTINMITTTIVIIIMHNHHNHQQPQ